MGQTTAMFPRVKKFYRKFFHSQAIDTLIRYALNYTINLISKAKGWTFPQKFNWDWKLEMLTHRYEQETVALFKKIMKPGMTVIDVGAHIGYFTVLFSKLVGPTGRVISFEADPDNFDLLKKNTGALPNVTLINKALADRNGTIDFYKINNSTGCHSIIAPTTLNSTKTTVSAITLDAFLFDEHIDKIDIIKIDIEGAEPLAFGGMQKLFSTSQSLMIVSEFNPMALTAAGIQPENFLVAIQKYGFDIFAIPESGEPLIALLPTNFSTLSFYQTGYTNLLLKKNKICSKKIY